MSARADTLEALEALIAAGTPGPWEAEHDVYNDAWAVGGGDEIVCSLWRLDEETHRVMPHDEARAANNAALIVAAVNALPGLIAEVKRLREALETEKRLHVAALLLTGDLKTLLADAHEDVCSLTCRSHFPAGHVHSDADHSDKCRRIRAALEPRT